MLKEEDGRLVLSAPVSDDDAKKLKAGDRVYISGVIYTARDAAHKRFLSAIKQGESLPFNVKGQIVYFVGPTPTKPGYIIGACGPTTSYRMDAYSPVLIDLGLKVMIGKGMRSKEVKVAMVDHNAVYMAATGGAGALLARSVKHMRIIAYEDLGPEAIRELIVELMPVIVINDTTGTDLYKVGIDKYQVIS